MNYSVWAVVVGQAVREKVDLSFSEQLLMMFLVLWAKKKNFAHEKLK